MSDEFVALPFQLWIAYLQTSFRERYTLYGETIVVTAEDLFLSDSGTNSKQSKMNTKVVEDRSYIYVSDVFFIKPSLKFLISHSVINFSDKKNTPSRQKKNCPVVLMYHYYTQFLVFTNPIFTKKGNKI